MRFGICCRNRTIYLNDIQASAAADDLAGRHPQKFITDGFNQTSLVSNENNSSSGVAHDAEDANDFLRGNGIHVGERFIEQNNAGIVNHSPRQRESLEFHRWCAHWR